jgi:hypothetical protein
MSGEGVAERRDPLPCGVREFGCVQLVDDIEPPAVEDFFDESENDLLVLLDDRGDHRCPVQVRGAYMMMATPMRHRAAPR